MNQPRTLTLLIAHEDARLLELEQHRSLRLVRSRGTTFRGRLLLHIGRFLVRVGQVLQERYPSNRHAGPDACTSAVGKASA
jgi:hypothetical protein